MEMQAIKSSMIKAMGYDADSEELHVEFNNGKGFKYPGVTQAAFDELQSADSVGSFFHKNIKNNFKGVPV